MICPHCHQTMPEAERRARATQTMSEGLIRDAAKANGCTPEEVLGPRRFPHLVNARRQVAVALRSAGWSMPRIGRLFGGRDHTSVINWLKPKRVA